MQIKLTTLKCTRCTHTWFPRSTERPTICPKCKSPYWDRERKGGRPKKEEVTK